MVQLSQVFTLAAFVSLTRATPLFDLRSADFSAKGLLEAVKIPRGWSPQGVPQPGASIKMQIALKQKNIDGLQAKLMDISDPKSANYGKWLTKEEVEVYTSPAAATLEAVTSWLAINGIAATSISQPTPDWMEVVVPISKAETMLSTKYTLYQDSESGRVIPRTDQYSIPLVLHDHIDTIQPTTAFSRNLAPKIAQGSVSGTTKTKRATCDPNNITPACIQSYYNVDYTSKGNATLGVTGFIGLSASNADATTFVNTYATRAKGANFKSVSISGATNQPGNPSLEGNLDTQYALGLGYPNPVTFYTVGPSGNDFDDQLVNFGNYLNSAASPPSSVSTSYGGEEQTFSSNYLNTICNNFMKAGARGVSVFFSSGDYGVGGNGESSCNQGFYALFPASCPYITSVGGTQLVNNVEQAAAFQNGGGTGGGFSYFFKAPSYQTADTKKYISTLPSSYNGYYNPSGRGYPDVSLVAEYYDIILSGSSERVYGTSCSSPAWAALISLINDYRHGEGKPNLGFLNPLLYATGAPRNALKDITAGSNGGCGTTGFTAKAGWDAATGLGSMNFASLRAALA